VIKDQLSILASAYNKSANNLNEEANKWILEQQDPLITCANNHKQVLVDDAGEMVLKIYSIAFIGLGQLASYAPELITSAENIANTY